MMKKMIKQFFLSYASNFAESNEYDVTKFAVKLVFTMHLLLNSYQGIAKIFPFSAVENDDETHMNPQCI